MQKYFANGKELRTACRHGDWSGPTPGQANGYVQANLVMIPRQLAFEFMLFCQRNPKPCPLIEVTEAGDPCPANVAADADLRSDLPAYRIYQQGVLVAEPTNLKAYWREDLVSFLIGCSFTFENALIQAQLPVRHLEQGSNVPMYKTNIPCRPAGPFRGPMVVSMRPMTPAQALSATVICSRFPLSHGIPIHLGDPQVIGINDLSRPDYGDPVEIRPNEIPVFWACGVTPQAIVVDSRPEFVITHKPGHMFITDLHDQI